MAVSAEQDNRVGVSRRSSLNPSPERYRRCKCGAVLYGESRSLEIFREGRERRKEEQPLRESISLKTQVRRPTEQASSASCELWEVRLSQKNGCGTHILGAAVFFF